MRDVWTTPTLTGRHVRLAPLQAAQADALRVAASDGELWTLRYTSVPGPQPGDAETYIDAALAQRDAGTALPFAVFDADGDIVGSTRFYDIDRSVPRVKLGYTWYARRAQRTGLNTEAKLLLIGHAFERWACASVTLETSHENLRSQAAILRLGAQRECQPDRKGKSGGAYHQGGSLKLQGVTRRYREAGAGGKPSWPEARRQLRGAR